MLTTAISCTIIYFVDSTTIFGGFDMDITQRQITKIAREVNRFTVRTLKSEGIGSSELDLIHLIRKNPGITQANACAVLGTDKGAVARQCASLEAKGYIERKENPDDGRSRLLFPTGKAEKLKNSKAHIEASFYEWLAESLPEGEKREFARLLDILYQKCKEESKANFPHITDKIKEGVKNEK